jgi:glycine cleavage system aminomethyltransferase T/glycine/D-amino acid oxidase-like deaminating enzyme
MRSDAAVVIIGGGIIGCSIAYHLTHAGCRDVVLLEKGDLTSGTTFHSVGLVSQFRTSTTDALLMSQSIRLYRQIAEEIGEAAGWRPVGSLRLASSGTMLQGLRRGVSQARALGLDVALVSAAEALRLCPAMSGEGLLGAAYIPDDGYLEPNSITRELARRAAAHGAEIVTGTLATGLHLDPRGRIRAVETSGGEIRTECVVNAAGQWAPRVATMAGVVLPIVPLMHQYLVTRPVPGQELPRQTPVVRDPENLVYVREEVGGYLVGGFEPLPKAWRLDDVPWEFTQQLLPGEWELFEPLLTGAIRRFPAVEKAEILQLVNGPDGFTPDGHYALGPVPGRPGFWVAAGMSINGIAGAGGVGRVMAEWILEGAPSIEVSTLNVRRFGPHLRDRRVAAEKAREVYRYYYAPRFPCDETEWGRPGRTGPLFERLLALGGVFGERGGWELAHYFIPGQPGRRQGADERTWGPPRYWAHVAREHRAVRERVGILDRTSLGKVDVSGPGALAFLQHLCANDVDCEIGRLVRSPCLNSRGGIECDVTVTRLGPSAFRITTGTASAASDLGWLYLHRPDDGSVTIADVTDHHAVISLWGPDARRTLARVSGADLSPTVFPLLTSRVIGVSGIEVDAARLSLAGGPGYELVVPVDGARAVWDAVRAAGREFGIESVGDYALNTLRLEQGAPFWGDDLGPGDTPLEVGLGHCVRFDKREFIGRDALLRQRDAGIARTLVPLVLARDAGVLWGGETVLSAGRVVGRVRSAGHGHTIGSAVALASLPVELGAPGTAVGVEVFGELVPAEVRAAPLCDPAGVSGLG